MNRVNLSVFVIVAVAAMMGAASITPAYANASDRACDRVFEQALRALGDGNVKLAQNIFGAFLASCLNNVPANCQNLFEELLFALEAENIPKVLGILKAIDAACS